MSGEQMMSYFLSWNSFHSHSSSPNLLNSPLAANYCLYLKQYYFHTSCQLAHAMAAIEVTMKDLYFKLESMMQILNKSAI
jgi:hypothetical protein